MSKRAEIDLSDEPPRMGSLPHARIGEQHAERRQLTVMFVDIVGSTPLSERIDPEEFFSVVSTYRDICYRQISRFGGQIARLIGDGLLAYFGVPQAHEDDPERAVRASLAIATAIKEQKFPIAGDSFVRLGVRIGLNTGVVVVGSVPGEPPERREVFGSSVHIAARLQEFAGENGVVIGPGTYQLIGERFSCVPLGKLPLKGVKQAVEAWRVEAIAAGESRFDRRRGSPLPPVIGRTAESAMLREMWQRTAVGSGCVGVICGEPGIGKSRLVREFRACISAAPMDVLSWQCSPFHVNTPLAPEIERLKRATGMQESDRPELLVAKLRALLVRAVRDVERPLRYYGAVLSIPACAGYEPADLGSPSERERAFQTMVGVLAEASRTVPILVIVEDVQWVDPTSKELIKRAVTACSRERVMFLVTHRDDYDASWLSAPTTHRIGLQKLPTRESEDMVMAVAGTGFVPHRIVRQIVERTDGIPLFVEEFTRTVIESGVVEHASDEMVLSRKLPEPLVPASIHDSLMERLDRLGAAKRVAQIASVFGRQFDYEGILNVFPGRGEALKRALQTLESAGIVYLVKEAQGGCRYVFKHVMIQEAAYSTLLKEERRELHARTASWLLEQRNGQPAILGYHYARAGKVPEAVDALLRAGISALQRSATKEAVAHLREGIALVSKLPASPQRYEAEIALQSNLAMAYTAIAGWSDPNVYGPYSRAFRLCASYGTIREKTVAMWGISVAQLVNCELAKAFDHVSDFMRRAEEWDDDEAMLMACTAALIVNFFIGNLNQAHRLAGLIKARYNRRDHGKLVQIYQHDPMIVSLVYSGHIEWLLGRPRLARECCARARQLAEEIGHPFMVAFASILGVSDHWYEGDQAANLACVEHGMDVAQEYGYPMYRVIGPLWATSALTARGQPSSVLDELCGLLGKLPAENRCIQMPLYKILLAAEFGRIGEKGRALALAASAESLMRRTGERWAAPEIHRIHGTLLRRGPDPDDRGAMRLFKRSFASAEKLGAIGWELRTAISLANLLKTRNGGARAKARDLLALARKKFPAGETSADLREADELLQDLVD